MDTIERLAEKIRNGTSLTASKFITDAEADNIVIFYFNGKNISGKKDFFNNAETVMDLPEYFGHNWDAFEECINEIDRTPAEGYIFIYDNTSIFFSKHPDDAEILKDILNDVKNSFRKSGTPFEVILAEEDIFSS